MLRGVGRLQQLSVSERLVLLAIAHELREVSGRGVLGSDVASITGFSGAEVEVVSFQLQQKGLLRVDWHPRMLYLSGDALTHDLCGEKLALFEEAEKKYYGVPRTFPEVPLQPTA